MEHSGNACPVCSNIIQDSTKEECDKCGWILKIEDLLDLRTSNLLLNWASRYYDKVVELEGRGKYRQDRFNSRLDTQRDDIDCLKKQIKTIFNHFPEITFGLQSQETIINSDEHIVYSISPENNLDSAEIDEDVLETVNIDLQSSIILQKQEQETIPTDELPQPQQEIISDYYYNPKEFAAKYQVRIANITKDSIQSNRGNEEKNVILEETNRGNYWIFNFGDYNYLVPVEDKYINQHSYTTTSTIFDGNNYTPDYHKIQLIKPAIVSIDPNTNPQLWRLQQRGELAFL